MNENEKYMREMWQFIERTGLNKEDFDPDYSKENSCGACQEVADRGCYPCPSCCPTFCFGISCTDESSPYYQYAKGNISEKMRWAGVIARMPWRTLRPRIAWLNATGGA